MANEVEDKKWKTWQDWCNLVLGIVLAISPAWAAYGAGAGKTWAIIGGIVMAVIALWSLGSAASAASEWTQIVVDVIVFILPWCVGASSVAGGWWMWVIAVIALILAIWSMQANKQN